MLARYYWYAFVLKDAIHDVLNVYAFFEILIAGAPPLEVPPVEQPMPVPPMDGTADHPDHYIPEPVRHFLPYFHKQIVEKVYTPTGVHTCTYMFLYTFRCFKLTLIP